MNATIDARAAVRTLAILRFLPVRIFFSVRAVEFRRFGVVGRRAARSAPVDHRDNYGDKSANGHDSETDTE